jgi:acyl carrier protein
MNEELRLGFTRESLRDKVLDLMCENARVLRQDLAEDKRLRDDLHIDSFDFLGIVSAVEGEFGITVSDEDASHLRTVGDVCDALWQKLGSGGPPA